MSESIQIALIAAGGVIIGSLLTLIGQYFMFLLNQRALAKKDEPRKKLLKEMLLKDKKGWRDIKTLMHVIGADEELTKRLLIEIGARGNEKENDVWALTKYKPLPK